MNSNPPILEARCPKCKTAIKFYREEIGESRKCQSCETVFDLIEDEMTAPVRAGDVIGVVLLVVGVFKEYIKPTGSQEIDALLDLTLPIFCVYGVVYTIWFRKRSSRH